MKYDPNKKQSRGIERTQRAFAAAMFNSLAEKPFDKITVNALCKRADYPRATFYNYFDDKFDLLDFCWYKIAQDINIEIPNPNIDKSTIIQNFAQIYKLFDQYHILFQNIIDNNPIDSQLVNHFIHYFTEVIYESIKCNLNLKAIKAPAELVAQHCSTTIIEVLKWIFLGKHDVSLEDAEEYLNELLSGPVQV
ncbi:TetR family transcriptional regulator [Companilactobacillus suantsaicola]|uniref:TetR family transcriptional regulator n=1 Tax=Companilactobacillus suantsaicola TaxID=2487723 RepID=A0A4Z0JDX9_9LACO|nr:TetR/AcrR family transcriptional regulator [Companilactobacillus suantsaicola]TGD21005.1 TetR family transcriptional regulator [Companilactobacillus suantsaicola]